MYKYVGTKTVWRATALASVFTSGGRHWFLTNNTFSASDTAQIPTSGVFAVDLTDGSSKGGVYDKAIVEWVGTVVAPGAVTDVTACNVRGLCSVLPYQDGSGYLSGSVLESLAGAGILPQYASTGEAGAMLTFEAEASVHAAWTLARNLFQGCPLWAKASTGITPVAGMKSRFVMPISARRGGKNEAGTGAAAFEPTVSGYSRIAFALCVEPAFTGSAAALTLTGNLMVHLYKEFGRSIG